MTAGKFALVFQGPVVSKNPRTSEVFDCWPNIIRIMEETRDEFDAFVVSTWEGQPDTDYRDDKLVKVFGPDTITGADRTGFPLNNGPRKIVSSHRGVEAVQKLGDIDYVLVFRTDTYADLRGFAEAIRSYARRHDAYTRVDQKAFLHFQYISLMFPYFATDFFVAGHVDDVARYLGANVRHLDLRFRPLKLIDVDWFIKYAYEHLSRYFDYPEYFSFPFVAKGGEIRPGITVRYPTRFIEFWQDIVRHAIAPMPARIGQTLEWRGTRVNYAGPDGEVGDGPGALPPGGRNELVWLEQWDAVREDWLAAARERGLDIYAYDDGGAPYDHAAWYMLDRYLIVKGSPYSAGFYDLMTAQRLPPESV